MQVEIKAVEDENFRFTTTDETDDLKDDSHVSSIIPEVAEQPVQSEPPKRREATLNNPSGHEWFNGTSWGVK